MDLRPLSYEEMCQMELLQAAGTAAVSNAGNTTTTMLPIMVIPTSMMLPGTTILTTAAPTTAMAGTASSTDGGGGGICTGLSAEQYFQLQPTHILATVPATQQATPLPMLANSALGAGGDVEIMHNNEQHPQQQQQQQQQHHEHEQLPQQQSQQLPQQQPTLNILYTGTLTKAKPGGMPASTANATLPRGFQPAAFIAPPSSVEVESDFEGSECGASVSATTCIPPFRFGGCGMILQPSSTAAQQQQQHRDAVVGCASLSHMMGSFAAGGAMQAGRFAGTLAGVGAGLSSTLTRNRRGANIGGGGVATQTPKRVSFKGDNLPPPSPPSPPPPPSMAMADFQMDDAGMAIGVGMGMGAAGAGNFNNCTYMHFDNYMDYQTTGFGGLPDVTEHSNIRRTLSRQNSISNSDSGGEIASIQKSKVNFGNDAKSPTLTSTSSSKEKRKSKAAREGDAGAAHKSRRGSCMVALTLVSAICLLAIAATLAYQHFLMAPSRNSHAQRLRIVRRILREVPLVDGHNNFAWNVRKYAHSSLELVHLSQDLDHKSMWARPTWAQTDMERLKQGLVGVQVWSAYVPCEAQGLDAVQLALEQIDIIRRLSDLYAQETTLVTSSQEIAAARRQGLMASLIGIEGGHSIGSSLGVLRSFYSLGARYLSLTHKCDVSWAGSSASPLESGLTQFGKAIIREMNRLGMMIDLSYSSDATARDVLQVTRAPVIFSHSAARALCNSTRNIPDDILRLVAENGGLIMISFDSEDVSCGRQARLKDVIEHIKYVRAIAGIQHIGLGAGYDGIELPPVGLEDVSKYPDLLASLLEDHNWSEEDIAMLAGKNFMRIMETVENVRDYWKRAAILPIEQTEPLPKSQCTYMSS